MTAAEFLDACTTFARRHPAAVLEMASPELAIDPRAASKHLRSTIALARTRMRTTARLALRPPPSSPPDLFGSTPAKSA